MCGIAGYVGPHNAGHTVLEGLKRLEYRGYDSAGIAIINPQHSLYIAKKAGTLDKLTAHLNGSLPQGSLAIGHTRWATHGVPVDRNAHPHLDCSGTIAVVHNGIVENYLSLKSYLIERGHVFRSDTDTEVVPHLLEELALDHDFVTAVRLTLKQLVGNQAFVFCSTSQPDLLVAARLGSAGGIVLGYGDGGMFLASDLPAILPHTQRVVYLEPGEIAVVTPNDIRYMDLSGEWRRKTPHESLYRADSSEKGLYPDFMLKEIYEQPEGAYTLIREHVRADGAEKRAITLDDVPFKGEELASFRRVILVGCGSSWHAALVGKHYFETLAGVQAEAEVASELRYRDVQLSRDTLLIPITQSGETVDTLAAMEIGRRMGSREIVLCNMPGSQATRLADGTIDLRAGLEIGVASSKTFTASLIALYCLAVALGEANGRLDAFHARTQAQALINLPVLMRKALETDALAQRIAAETYEKASFLYLGRWVNYPIAEEGALKLKEIAYTHAEGYPAGEMKHGPIALIDQGMPIVMLAPCDRVQDKMAGNIQEVKARGGCVIALGEPGDDRISSIADQYIPVPSADPLIAPILNVIPLQLLAYHIATRKGLNVDKPRNLAKTVTVE